MHDSWQSGRRKTDEWMAEEEERRQILDTMWDREEEELRRHRSAVGGAGDEQRAEAELCGWKRSANG